MEARGNQGGTSRPWLKGRVLWLWSSYQACKQRHAHRGRENFNSVDKQGRMMPWWNPLVKLGLTVRPKGLTRHESKETSHLHPKPPQETEG